MRSLSGASLALVAMLSLGSIVSSVGCAKVGEIRGRKAFKSANQSYQAQDYKKAAEYYEETIEASPDTQAAHQSLFFLGNSYDNLYKPSKKGDAENDGLMQKAVTNYQKAAESLSASADPADKKLGKLALQYLVSSYGPDKLNDPAKAEPVVNKVSANARLARLARPQRPLNFAVMTAFSRLWRRHPRRRGRVPPPSTTC